MSCLCIRACSLATFCARPLKPRWEVGEVLYRKDLAKRGIIDRVKIAELLFNPPRWPFVVVYKDTLNTLHTEEWLCEEPEAAALYYAYLEQQKMVDEEKLMKIFPCLGGNVHWRGQCVQ